MADFPGSDIDIMRDVYMTNTQRAAFDRIAAALEAAREDAERWRDRYVAELSCYRMDLHGDTHNEAIERARETAAKIAAIDQARGIVPEAGHGVGK